MINCPYCKEDFDPRRKNQKYCSVQCGDAIRAHRWRERGQEKKRRKTPRGRYHVHKTNAATNGTAFKLTFEEWWSIWEPYWAEDNYGKLCMCRTKDQGAYELGNVRIDTWQNNYREARNMPLV